MTEPPSQPNLGFFTSPPHACGYLPGRNATTMFADPRIPLSPDAYSWLSAHGFRRSGTHVYRPLCTNCSACVAVRVAVDDFRPRRQQRRTLARNADLKICQRSPRYELEHFQLYERYLNSRHADSQMEASDPSAYMSFLTAAWCETSFYEFRLAERLLAVAVVDRLGDALSSVYTFFSPDYPARSLGRLAILKQIEWARESGLRWLYLGYWIEDCRKMNYKNEYAPLEYFRGGRWAPGPNPDAKP